MIVLNLFPRGVMQLRDAPDNGYWHARNLLYPNREFVRMIEWFRLPGDIVLIAFEVVLAVVAGMMTYCHRLVGGPRNRRTGGISKR